MWYQVVQQAHTTSLTVPLQHTSHRTHTRCHKRHPIAKYNQICLFIGYLLAHTYPVQWIHRIEQTLHQNLLRGFGVRVLRLTREKKRRILKRKSHYLHLMPFGLKLSCKSLVERCQSTPIRMCRTYDDYFHCYLTAYIAQCYKITKKIQTNAMLITKQLGQGLIGTRVMLNPYLSRTSAVT